MTIRTKNDLGAETYRRASSAHAELLAELRAAYPDDQSAPGVVTAQVRATPRPRYYAAAVRYRAALGEGRQVVASVRGPSLPRAILDLLTVWRDELADERAKETKAKEAKGVP